MVYTHIEMYDCIHTHTYIHSLWIMTSYTRRLYITTIHTLDIEDYTHTHFYIDWVYIKHTHTHTYSTLRFCLIAVVCTRGIYILRFYITIHTQIVYIYIMTVNIIDFIWRFLYANNSVYNTTNFRHTHRVCVYR